MDLENNQSFFQKSLDDNLSTATVSLVSDTKQQTTERNMDANTRNDVIARYIDAIKDGRWATVEWLGAELDEINASKDAE